MRRGRCGERLPEVGFADDGSEVRAVWPAVGGGVGLVNVNDAANRVAGRGERRLQPRQVLGGVINHFLAEVGADDVVTSEQCFLQDGASAAEGVEDCHGSSASSRLLQVECIRQRRPQNHRLIGEAGSRPCHRIVV